MGKKFQKQIIKIPSNIVDNKKENIVVYNIFLLKSRLKDCIKIIFRFFIYFGFIGSRDFMLRLSSKDLANDNRFSSLLGGAIICMPKGHPSLEKDVAKAKLGQLVNEMQAAIIIQET